MASVGARLIVESEADRRFPNGDAKEGERNHRSEGEVRHPVCTVLTFSARVFQVTRCSACGAPLDLPTVHFMCKHSFHQRYKGPLYY